MSLTQVFVIGVRKMVRRELRRFPRIFLNCRQASHDLAHSTDLPTLINYQLSTISNQGTFALASRSVSTVESVAETIRIGCSFPVKAMCQRVHAMSPLLAREACSMIETVFTTSLTEPVKQNCKS